MMHLRTDTPPAELLVSARDELAALDQWVVWTKWNGDKLLINPSTGQAANHSDPTTWSSYAAARAIAGRYNGLGFVFHKSDPYAGVDLDGCRDAETGAITEWAQIWIDRLDSYSEISPSETGVKIWVRGKLPENVAKPNGQAKHVGIELYDHSRYFCFTGRHLAGTPETINKAQQALDDLYRTLRPEQPKPEPRRTELKVSPGEQVAEEMTLTERYAEARKFILDHYDLVEALEDADAIKTRSGYSCPFCKHVHKTTLRIEPGGKVGYSLSPNCKLASPKGLDVTNVLILKDHYRRFDDLARVLAPHCFPKPKPKAEQRQAPEYLTAAAAEQRRNDNECKQAERQRGPGTHRAHRATG